MKYKRRLMAGFLFTGILISLIAGGSPVAGQGYPTPPHRVWGDVTYEDGSPAADVTINFVNDNGDVVTSDRTDENGYYDTALPPGLENNISEPEDKTLDVYVREWDSGENLEWEPAGATEIDISGVPKMEPTVTTENATDIDANSATLHMSYDFKDYGSGSVRFQYRQAEGSWSATSWAFKSGSGSYSKTASGLSSGTDYEFRAQVRFGDDNLKSGSIETFTTKNQAPDAGFSYSPSSPRTGETVSFDGTLSSDSDGSIASYEWDWTNDGTYEATGSDPSHSYSDDGTYTVKLKVTDDDGATDTVTKDITVRNRKPDAGFSYSPSGPNPGDSVSFDAGGSSDPDGSIQSYSWSFGDGSSASGGTVSHSYSSTGDYTVTLTVEDDDGATSSVSKTVSVVLANEPPNADANGPYTVDEGKTVQLDGTGSSDPDGNIASYSWSITSGPGSLQDSDTAQPTYLAPDNVASDTDVTVELTVTDGDSATDSATATITVNNVPVNDPPTAKAGGPYSVDEKKTVSLDGTGSSDPDGDSLSYSWPITNDPTGQASLSDSDTANPTLSAPSVDSDTEITVELTVSDGHGHSDTATATVTVNNVPVNDPPTAKTGGPYSVDEGKTVKLDGTGSSDPDGSVASYSWEITSGPGSLESANSAEPTYVAPDDVDSDTEVTVKLTVTDDDGATDSATATITVNNVPVNEAPSADANGPYSVDEKKSVQLDGTASSDSDGDSLSYSWEITNDPTGRASLSGADTANPTLTAPSVDSDTEITVKLTVSDGHGHSDSSTATVTVNNVPANEMPSADANGPYSVEEEGTVTLDGTGSSDPDGSIASYSWEITSGPGKLQGSETSEPKYIAPDELDSDAEVTVELTVTDGDGASSTASATISVSAVNDLPGASANGPYSVSEGESVTLDGTGSSDPDGSIASYSWSIASGPGSMEDSDSAEPTYVAPDQVDSDTEVTVELTVTDDGGATDTATATINVGSVNESPSADAGGPYSVDEGKSVTLDGSGSDPDGDSLSYTWEFVDDPTGEASLSGADTSSPTLNAPSVGSDTEITVELTVSDGHGHSDTATATVTVNNVPEEGVPVWPFVAVIVIVVVIVVAWLWQTGRLSSMVSTGSGRGGGL